MNLLAGNPLFTVANHTIMQLNHLQSEIIHSVRNLKTAQQQDVLLYIADLQKEDQRIKEKLKDQALKEIRQALRKEVFV